MPLRNPFRVKLLQQSFDSAVQMFKDRHPNLFAVTGEPHRLNGVASPFWQGYFGEPGQLIQAGTISHAVFRAGQACRREFQTELPHDGRFIPIGAEKHYPPTSSSAT